MGMLDLIQDAITLKDCCMNTKYCYRCKYKGLCYNYFKVEPRYIEVLKIGQVLREIQRRDY